MMQKLIQATLWTVLACAALPAQAANPGCERKAAEIEQQLDYAKTYGNVYRQRGLERALTEVRTHCTDAGLVSEKRSDIAEQNEKVNEIQAEIEEKQTEGRLDKVRKLERKLEREREELRLLQNELRELESGFTAK
ncbi:DUF1090 domain-containing protein [Kerstersia gyiorum]|uniref:DUF1090 domain-containing protein n=1 Tax=Kerstersia gyiorum TaxID=206506 RepID=UPI0020A13876|nr:DUF1090 domain-containing protein [Kerstersia gyiorum]MCP1632779.1 putative RNase H-like nuclease (RuvC/YqgF family) [Kerstersia gyiorum]MCP1635690.1 putative RNase H-like nuclease (RuvC/YqgF family) [Kerstersia gyiorum]MCP1670903.1 putative RNase H-like nuclease (RuvC/YqgF family) [Kerstersia gyiorum]MCP1678443.1 putative RNase H-like nuclease (RuvC/YqgF family) [Kerstersia gyiorum]MCP1682240.1 putative RNase H-like nuclease (RuvC/YqgF family) [Kerstersia gyiorum]